MKFIDVGIEYTKTTSNLIGKMVNLKIARINNVAGIKFNLTSNAGERAGNPRSVLTQKKKVRFVKRF